MKKLIFLLLILIVTSVSSLAESSQEAKASTPTKDKTNISTTPTDASSTTLPTKDFEKEVTRLEEEIFWLGLLAAIGFILPLPLGFYHSQRVKSLITHISDLEAKLNEQAIKAAEIGPVTIRNEKLESELKQMQERFRTTMKNTQDKHQETIERMKNDMHLLELENKRISGILMLKEQVAKKSSPGN